MKINVGKKILSANEEYAAQNRGIFIQKKLLCLNMISSPGSGKTTTLVRTITQLGDKLKIGVIEGDIQTDHDAEQIRKTGAPAIQINTEGSCHLSAAQVNNALESLALDELEVVVIENVGNLVCPSAFELGETAKVALLSVAEGDDKPLKYPAIFAKAKAVVINKIDMIEAGVVDFDIEKVKKDIARLNHDVQIFEVSAKTGAGFDAWCEWIQDQAKKSN